MLNKTLPFACFSSMYIAFVLESFFENIFRYRICIHNNITFSLYPIFFFRKVVVIVFSLYHNLMEIFRKMVIVVFSLSD